MIKVSNPQQGIKKIQAAMKDYDKMAAQQARGVFRAARAGRTRAAKEIRAHTGYPSRRLKQQLKRTGRGASSAVEATRVPIPVEMLRAREDRDTDIVEVRNWPTSAGRSSNLFQPARERNGRYYALIRGRWRRLFGQSVARAWTSLHVQIQSRMREVYSRHMQSYIQGVRRRAGAQ